MYNNEVKLLGLEESKKKKLIIGLGVCLFLALTYLFGFFYFSSHFLPHTSINGIDVSNLKLTATNEKLSQINPYINVIEKNKNGNGTITETIDLKQIRDDISFDCSNLLNKQSKIGWFTSLFSAKELICDKVSGSYQKAKVLSLVKDLYCTNPDNITYPEDATLSLNQGKIELLPSRDGSYIKENTAYNLVRQSIEDLFAGQGNDTLDLTQSYELPSLREDNPVFEEKKQKMEKVLSKTISFSLDGENSIILKTKEIGDLLKVENYALIINEDSLSNYLYTLYKENDGFSKSQLIDSLRKSLLSEQNEAIGNIDKEKIEKSLIDVSVKQQLLCYYENDVLILTSPVVTGNGNITDETPHGHFYIRKMQPDSYLMGRDYIEHVDYWIGFDETGRIYGLHDAPWRNEFGGDIYLTDPSRGCVNMPIEKITQLYSYVDLGVEVYIHD